jgi:diguanylate cyclase (GGDEF)-like protein
LPRAGVLLLIGVLVFATVLIARPLLAGAVQAVDDLGELLAAATAAVCCAAAARRGADQQSRLTWRLLAAATGSWAAGEAIWSYYELVAGRDVPFPSLADLGFLGFPGLAAAALITLPGAANTGAARIRNLLDGLIIAGSLLVLAWPTSLGAALDAGGPTRLAAAVGLAYPLGDLLVLTMVLLVVGRADRGQRSVLVLLAAGLAAVGVSDSGFVVLTSNGSYASGNLCDLGWTAGFALLAGAALATRRADSAESSDRPAVPGWLRLTLPYLPLLAAETVVAVQMIAGDQPVPTAEVAAGLGLIVVVLARQFLTLADNRRLLALLHHERDAARHQALHDPLTGLANRSLFADRTAHALALADRTGTATTVLFCDVDDFKHVNDSYGHAAGDQLLQIVGDRLRAQLRSADTVARLGGDEFGVLVEHADPADSPDALADRLVAALAAPAVVDGRPVTTTVSIGLATAWPGADDGLDPADLLRRADRAMYHAKAAGRATWISYSGTATEFPVAHGSVQSRAADTAVLT